MNLILLYCAFAVFFMAGFNFSRLRTLGLAIFILLSFCGPFLFPVVLGIISFNIGSYERR